VYPLHSLNLLLLRSLTCVFDVPDFFLQIDLALYVNGPAFVTTYRKPLQLFCYPETNSADVNTGYGTAGL